MRGNYVRLDYGNYRDIFHTLEKTYHLWGYTLASIPLLDDADFYEGLLTPKEYEKTIRFVHSDGRVLALRSDITLFLIKFIASYAMHEQLPLRLSYLGEIIRTQDQHDLSEHETLQSGAELIGVDGLDADAEIILLLQECLKILDGEDRFLHIGSRAVLKTIAQRYDCDYVQLSKIVYAREQNRCAQLLATLPENEREVLSSLLFFIGTHDEFTLWYGEHKQALPAEICIHCDYMLDLCDILTQCDRFSQLRIDFSEIGSHTYYSGIVFSLYQNNASRALASGGRYDDLLFSLTQKRIPAAGFSLYPLQLSHIQHTETPVSIDAGSFRERFHSAQKNRQKGKATIL